MRFRCLTCEALARPVYWCAATSPHIVDVELVRRGLHDRPNDLRSQLQAMINDTPSPKYDAVLLVYGLCGQATAGLKAGAVPLVMPKAHDCITLFLGSRARYQEQFTLNPGTYWYSYDYIERKDGASTSLAMGSNDAELKATYEKFVQKYGRDNADYLMEVMGAWKQHYNRAAFIDLGVGDSSVVEQQAQEEARRRGWSFDRLVGDLSLIHRLVNGEWDADFLSVLPGRRVVVTAGEDVLAIE